MDNTLGNKSNRQASNALGRKSHNATHSLGLKTHQVIQSTGKGSLSGSKDSLSKNSQLEETEPVGLKNNGMIKPKKSYLEK